MELFTIIGVGFFWLLVLAAMHLAGGILPYYDLVSVIIVFGGTTAVLISSFDLRILKNFGKYIKIALSKDNFSSGEKAKRITLYSLEVKKNGKLSIEPLLEAEPCPFTKTVLKSFIDGMAVEEIEALYTSQIEGINGRHSQIIGLFDLIGSIAGSMGMAGTLVGLVSMLINMSDPSAIGPAMAVALLTTLYGAVIGNGFASPVSSRLSLKNKAEILDLTISLNGVLSIANGENPRLVEQKLMCLLSPSDRLSNFDQQ